MIRMDEFLDAFKNEDKARLVRFATIEAGYTSGRPRLIFDGESTPTGKAYPKLKSYEPTAGDRVMVVHGVVVGAIV